MKAVESEISVVCESRDPNDLNKHLEAKFNEILGEPEGVRSIDCVWKLSGTCFGFWRNFVYKVLSLLLGIFIAAGLGCEFAVMAITNVWLLTPLLRVLEINLSVARKAWTAVLGCCVQPCCEAFGGVFVNLKK